MEPPRKISKLSTNNRDVSVSKIDDSYDLSITDFEVLEKKSWYVDKTMFIREFFNADYVVHICAPKQFGKSVNMSMLKKFVEIEVNQQRLLEEQGKPFESQNKKLFENKKIYEDKRFFNECFGIYPVIFVDFKDVKGDSFDEVLNTLKTCIHKSFVEHSYLKESDIWLTKRLKKRKKCDKSLFMKYIDQNKYQKLNVAEIQTGLGYLLDVLSKHFNKKACVLIDNADTPFFNIVFNKVMPDRDIYKSIKYCRALLVKLMMDKDFEKIVINACHTRVAFGHDVKDYRFLTMKFGEFYGFTAEEVDNLLKRKKISNEQRREVKEWYNGYTLNYEEKTLFNMYCYSSILKYLESGEIRSYWSTDSITNFEAIFPDDRVQLKIKCLLDNINIKITHQQDIKINARIKCFRRLIQCPPGKINDKDVMVFFIYLYDSGYFDVVKDTKNEIEVKIPNLEIRDAFRKTFSSLDFFI